MSSVAALVSAVVLSASCPTPPASANFTFPAFEGEWLEIGKYQTYNPFENGCECTRIGYEHATGEFKTACVKQGKTVNATAHLIPVEGQPDGRFLERFTFGDINSDANLTIPAIGTFEGIDYMFEFDCSKNLNLNYCFHAFTRTGAATDNLIAYAKSFATGLGLNPETLQWQPTRQTNCTYN